MRTLDPFWKAVCICGLLGMTGCSSNIFPPHFVSQLFGLPDAAPPAPQKPVSAEPRAPSDVSDTAADGLALRPSIDGQQEQEKSSAQIQLGAYREEATANENWRRLAAQTGGLLSGLTPSIVSVDLPDRGRFYRLRAGVSDGNAAASLCSRLKSRGIACMAVKG